MGVLRLGLREVLSNGGSGGMKSAEEEGEEEEEHAVVGEMEMVGDMCG